MSAFVMSNESINRIVATMRAADKTSIWYTHITLPTCFDGLSDAEIGLSLWEMNIHAVSERYPNDKPEELPGPIEYGYKHIPTMPATWIQLYKSIQCYLYQCSEGDTPGSPLFKTMDDYKNSLANMIVNNSPAYEKCQWD